VWIAVRLPGDYEGAEGTAIRRWRTVVAHSDELGWLRGAMQLLACGDPDDEVG
jgi:hypothetical protein